MGALTQMSSMGGSAREEKRAYSAPELGIDMFLPGTNLVIFGSGKSVRLRVNTVS